MMVGGSALRAAADDDAVERRADAVTRDALGRFPGLGGDPLFGGPCDVDLGLAGRQPGLGQEGLVHQRARFAMQPARFVDPGPCFLELGLVASIGEAGQRVVEFEQQLAGAHPVADIDGDRGHQATDPRRQLGPPLRRHVAAEIENVVAATRLQGCDLDRCRLLRPGAGDQCEDAGEGAHAWAKSVHLARTAAKAGSFHICQS